LVRRRSGESSRLGMRRAASLGCSSP
jgi:hypothetical protein